MLLKILNLCRNRMTHLICEHNKRKSRCKECGGNLVCSHNRIKDYCKDCGGTQFCQHNRVKSRCKECGGGSICYHNKVRSRCKECGGSQICEHDKRKEICRECGGNQICEHNKRKEICRECGGSQICKHNIRKSTCKECGGSQICKHKKQKQYCKECGGSQLCKSSWCETQTTSKYKGYCLNCFVHLFPDESNTRNYKTKEKATTDYIFEKYPDFSWIVDKQIQDGCSRKRPDLLLDLGYQVIIIEVDENQHQDYNCSCENKRLMLLSQDVGHRSIIFIRFNPDDYITKDGKVTSCWGLNGKGICTVKKTKQKEWNERLEALNGQIEYWVNPDNKTEKTAEIIQLFYDCN